jgi:phosphocarrier protein
VKEREVVIGHRLGLHARAAARLVQLSSQFQSTIILFRSDPAGSGTRTEADARSILSILLLSAGYGSKVSVRADGSDEDDAVSSICEYLAG